MERNKKLNNDNTWSSLSLQQRMGAIKTITTTSLEKNLFGPIKQSMFAKKDIFKWIILFV